MKRQGGFTLIELMIVVAIIGILAAVAIPKYQDYVTSSKWASDISSLDSLKLAIELCLQENGGDLASCDTGPEVGFSGMPTPSYAAGSVAIVANTAAITFTGSIATGSFVYAAEPQFGPGAVLVWQRSVATDTIPLTIFPADQR